MILGVNLLSLRIEGGGARYFTESLLLELTSPQFATRHLLLCFCLAELKPHLEAVFEEAGNVSVVVVQSEKELVRCADLFDVYFCPLNALRPMLPSKPSVAVLHDIQEQYFPEFFSQEDLEFRAVLYPELVHNSTYACTVSQFCADTFLEKMQADPATVKAVLSFPQKRLLEAGAEVPESCPSDFMLYPANWYRHKNVQNLLAGYLRARSVRNDMPDLVLVGHPMGHEDWLKNVALTAGASQCIRLYTEISPEKLRGLYERSRFVVLPTLFEGYCMPLAEAIVFGRPVLANDLPVLREVGGDWPVYAKLGTADEIADALLQASGADRPGPGTELPPALDGWSWAKIAAEYETIFNQALVRHRIENLAP